MYDSWLFDRTRVVGALAIAVSVVAVAASEIDLAIVVAVAVAVALAQAAFGRLASPYDWIAVTAIVATGAALVLSVSGLGEVPAPAILVGALLALAITELVLPSDAVEP